MRKRHGKDLTEAVMLGHASQTSHVMQNQNVHGKPGNLTDPDIFTFDMGERFELLVGGEEVRTISPEKQLVFSGKTPYYPHPIFHAKHSA